MYTLTQEQLDRYAKEGYLLVKAHEHGLLVDPQSLPVWSEEVRNWPLEQSVGKWMPYFEDTSSGRQIMRTEMFADYHEGLDSLIRGEGLLSILKQLSGRDMQLFKDKINYKLPGGGGFAPHIDAPAYDHISRVEHVTANIAIHPATKENGCLEVVPGSHKGGVEVIPGGGHIAQTWVDSHEWVSVPLDTGDILFFGSHLAHGSGPNASTNPRAMLYATYAAQSDGPELRKQYYAHRREAFPPDYERVKGVDYTAGWERYAFAAPFSNQGITAAS